MSKKDKAELTPWELLRQLNGFIEEYSYPKGKEAIKAKENAEDLVEFITNEYGEVENG
jgi:hypothetical protein